MEHVPDELRGGVTWQVTTTFNHTGRSSLTNGITVSRTYYNNIEVNVVRNNMCDAIVGGCPVKPGLVVSKSPPVQISRFAPRGTYTTITKGSDRDGNEISCAEWKFTIQ